MSQGSSLIKSRLRAYSASKQQQVSNSGSKKIASSKEKESVNTLLLSQGKDINCALGEHTVYSEDMDGNNHPKECSLESLQKMLVELTTSVNSIKEDVKGLKRSKSNVQTLEMQMRNDLSNISQYREQQAADSFKIKLLSVIVICHDQKIDHLTRLVSSMQRESKKGILIIEGILEGDEIETNEKQKKLVKDFFKEQMEITEEIEIKQAFRIGKKNPRAMKVTLSDMSNKFLIFENISNLKGKANAQRKLFFINDNLLEDENEKKQYYRDLRKENEAREEEDKSVIKLKKGKLLSNNKVIQSKMRCPTVSDILTLDESKLEAIHTTKTYAAGSQQEEGSDFYCHYMKIVQEEDAECGLAKMKIKYGDATHIAMAYRLVNAKGPFGQGYLDDGEWGAG